MVFLYLAAASMIVRLLTALLKLFLLILLAYIIHKLSSRLIIKCFYSKLNRIEILKKKAIKRKFSIPTGYSEGYYRTEHYKYVYKQMGTRYLTKIFFGGKFFILCSFLDSDKLFCKILEDGGVSLDSINAKLNQK